MIPAAGRDVQCSNCMRTWFQSGPTKAVPEVADDLKIERPSPPPPPSEPKPPAPAHSTDYEDDSEDDLSSLPPSAVAAMAEKRQNHKIDDEALSVIQDEVAREQSARKAEAAPIETQIDLGIDDTETKDRAAAARDRMRSQTGDTKAEDIAEIDPDLDAALSEDLPEPEPATKRELLPDIEEINSTLSDSPDYDDEDLEDYMEMSPARNPKSRNRSGFRLGFGLMLLIAAALVGLYVYAPAFAKSVPATADFLEGYVSFVNGFRGWLDRSAQDLSDQITKLLGTVN